MFKLYHISSNVIFFSKDICFGKMKTVTPACDLKDKQKREEKYLLVQ